ncbi:MAG: hypothetical protein Q8P53_02015 [Candidatus Shapirobacteria bacterium]|nr:hypothetical protein [Candidatus Shapirobacteria bacterium]
MAERIARGISEASNKLMKNSLPSSDYESTVGVYGGKLKTINGELVYDMHSSFIDKIDVWGDRILRQWDDHYVQDFISMAKNHFGKLLGFVFHAEPMRRRGTPEEIAVNVERLGLSEYYGPYKDGIVIKKPEILTKGIAIADIFAANKIGSSKLQAIDRFQALAEETKYIDSVHQQFGPIGDIVGDVMFQNAETIKTTPDSEHPEIEAVKVSNPVLNIPDIILTPSERRTDSLHQQMVEIVKKEKAFKLEMEAENITLKVGEIDIAKGRVKKIIEREQKAIDIVELLISTAFMEIQRSKGTGEPAEIERVIKTILINYKDQEVLKMVRYFVKRGRQILPGDLRRTTNKNRKSGILNKVFSMHNQAHLGADNENSKMVRETILNEFKTAT